MNWAKNYFFSKIKVNGLGNIPKYVGVLFLPDNQGTFLDPLLAGCNLPRFYYSSTRSKVFGGEVFSYSVLYFGVGQ